MIPFRYNLRSLAVRKATTIATALGIALVVFVLASAQMLSHGIRDTLGKSGSADRAIVLRKGSDAELSSGFETHLVNLILAAPGVKRGVGEVLVVLALEKAGAQGQVSNVALRGVPDNALEFHDDVHIVKGRPFRAGADEVIVGKRLEGKFQGLSLGEQFEIKKNRKVQVVGLFESGGSSRESEVLGDIELVRSSFGREGNVSSVTVKLDSESKFDGFKSAIEHDKQLGLAAISEPAYYSKQSEGTAMLVTFLGGAIVSFFSIGATIGAMITMFAAVSHRRREIGTLRALGFSRFSVLASFLLEAVVLTLIGGGIGALASLAMGFVHFSMVNMASWSEITFSFDPSPSIMLFSLAVGGFMGLLGGFLPAFRAARTSPIEAMRD